jgi:CheY-like chemotaxis protein
MARVLVVDNCRDTCEIMADILGALSHEVETAGDSHEALTRLGVFRPHILTTGIALAGMDGLNLIRTIRARGNAETFIICITGYADDETCRQALAAGADAFLTKPVEIDALERAIAEGCARAAANRS